MQEKDKTRRKVLIGLTSAVGLSGLPFAATPFIAAWNPSAKAKAAGAAVKLDVSKMQYGQQIQVAWRKQPVFIVRHTKESIAGLDLSLDKLADPNSDEIIEPYKGLNPSRSKNPEYSKNRKNIFPEGYAARGRTIIYMKYMDFLNSLDRCQALDL